MPVPPKLTLDEINEILIRLDNLDLLTDNEIANYVDQITIGLPFQMLNFTKALLYRGRPNEQDQPFNNTKDLWCPPIDCIRCNRFNDNKTQILYLAESKSTVFDEIKPAIGTLLTMTTYEVKRELKLLPIGIRPGVTRTKIFSSDYLNKLFLGKMKIFGNNVKYMQIDQTINEYLYRHVTKENRIGDPKEYRLTNVYGKHFLKAPIDGLLYPSVSRKLFDINIALKREATQKLNIRYVELVRISNKNPYEFEIVSCSNEFKLDGEIVYNGKCGSFEGMKRVIK